MMRIGAWILPILLPLAAPQAATKPGASPTTPLGALPSIARVRVDVAADHVVVTEDVDLPRGDWHAGSLAFYVAFGAPGAPEAFDAHVLAVPDGALDPADADAGEKISIERAPRRPEGVQALLGPEEMAGVVVRIPEASFRRALEPGGMAVLRLRTLLRSPAGDPHAGRDVLVRLGQSRTTPLTLGYVQVGNLDANGPAITRAEAHLCGEGADPWPLAVATSSKQSAPRDLAGSQAPIAPVLAVRHPKDDLCVRFWLTD
jgi:hypothetical protein